ncbi:SDR family NAD(P)-dependent oxidoreductase [Roseobacteraceae bacterium S113]
MAQTHPMILVAGAGEGLGQAILTRFARDGYTPVGLGRTRPETVVGAFHAVDLSDPETAPRVLADVLEEYGPPKVVVHNTAELVIAPFAQTHLEDYQRCWTSMVQSAVLLAQSTVQPMVRAGGGAFIVSGATAALRGGAKFSAFASAKFALRGLTQSLAREYQPAGIHVCHSVLDGIIDTPRARTLHNLDPGKMMRTEDIAETYWHLARQPRSTWSHEINLRPATEGF